LSTEKQENLRLTLAAEEYLLITIPPSVLEQKVRVHNISGRQMQLRIQAAKEIKINRRGKKEFE